MQSRFIQSAGSIFNELFTIEVFFLSWSTGPDRVIINAIIFEEFDEEVNDDPLRLPVDVLRVAFLSALE